MIDRHLFLIEGFPFFGFFLSFMYEIGMFIQHQNIVYEIAMNHFTQATNSTEQTKQANQMVTGSIPHPNRVNLITISKKKNIRGRPFDECSVDLLFVG